MLWIREAEIFSEVDYASAGQRCRDFDLHGISGDVRGEDPVAPPHHFCHCICLGLCLAMARLPLDGAQAQLPARRQPNRWLLDNGAYELHTPWTLTAIEPARDLFFFRSHYLQVCLILSELNTAVSIR